MTQIATVEACLSDGYVRISVPRKSACGHDCENCAGCGVAGGAIQAEARDPLGARVGQRVVVESSTKVLLGVAALVYLLPPAGFLLGYFLSAGLTEAARCGIAILAGALFFLPSVWYDRRARRRGTLQYTVRQVL